MRKGKENTSSVETSDLQRKIHVDGQVVTIDEASKEQFDIYVYDVLYRMYPKKGHAHNRYELDFWEYDFSQPLARVFALDKLKKLNQLRAGPPTFKDAVALFVEEAHV